MENVLGKILPVKEPVPWRESKREQNIAGSKMIPKPRESFPENYCGENAVPCSNRKKTQSPETKRFPRRGKASRKIPAVQLLHHGLAQNENKTSPEQNRFPSRGKASRKIPAVKLLFTATEDAMPVVNSSSLNQRQRGRIKTGERGRGGGGGTHVVHGRTHVTIDPRIRTMPGRITSAFHGPGKTLLAPSADHHLGVRRVA